MRIKVLASGSKGNCCLVMTDQVKCLIDVGVSSSYIKEELAKLSLSLNDINFVLVSHTHSDHVKGLKAFLSKSGCKAYVPLDMKKEILEVVSNDYIEYIDMDNDFFDLHVELIRTSHDADCSVGFILTSQGKSLTYITDTGYINRKYLKRLKNKSVYILESNHDEKMLMDGPYPYYLKQRVISDSGHLSNKMASKYLEMCVGEETKYVVLAHLSETNNNETLAYNEANKRLMDVGYHGEIILAKQKESTKLIEV